jgi:hypothetical protein
VALLSVSGGFICRAKGVLQIEGLHPIGAHANAGKSAVICGVMSGKRRLREDPMENSQN